MFSSIIFSNKAKKNWWSKRVSFRDFVFSKIEQFEKKFLYKKILNDKNYQKFKPKWYLYISEILQLNIPIHYYVVPNYRK